MTLLFNRSDAISYLQQFMTHNKARGMIAEIALDTELETYKNAANKFVSGSWFLSPKVEDSHRYRYVAFVLPELYETDSELKSAVDKLQKDRGWQALATFLRLSSIGVIVAGATPNQSLAQVISPSALNWHNYIYHSESLFAANANEPFSKWPGNRGRASKGSVWQTDVVDRFALATEKQLTTLTLRQAFFYGYLKQELKKPFDDPYDIDAFLVSYRGNVLPVEVKEKSPTPTGDFGIDAGRILMLLRLCLATDSNALYLIREVDNSENRAFVGWRAITLSDMIMGCSWNLQAGGAGMGGGATQTVMMPGTLFYDFSESNLSEDWLDAHKSLQESVKFAAVNLLTDLTKYLG